MFSNAAVRAKAEAQRIVASEITTNIKFIWIGENTFVPVG
jgi:hypothetical protein